MPESAETAEPKGRFAPLKRVLAKLRRQPSQVVDTSQQLTGQQQDLELTSLLKDIDTFTETDKQYCREFVEECKQTGYIPTLNEVTMFFHRNAFWYEDKRKPGKRSLLLENPIYPITVSPSLSVEPEVNQQVNAILNSWGEVIGSPELELASQLYQDLIYRARNLAEADTPEKKHWYDRTRKFRDAFCSRQKGADDLPMQTTLKYMTAELSKDPWYNRLIPPREKSRKEFFSQLTAIRNMGFRLDSVSRMNFEQLAGDCMIALIQDGGTEPVQKEVAKGIAKLYGFMGLERYANPQIALGAITRVLEATAPIRNHIIYEANRVIGPAPMPK